MGVVVAGVVVGSAGAVGVVVVGAAVVVVASGSEGAVAVVDAVLDGEVVGVGMVSLVVVDVSVVGSSVPKRGRVVATALGASAEALKSQRTFSSR